MTRDELIEKVARKLAAIEGRESWNLHKRDARAVIDIVAEEAARIPEMNSRVCTYTMADVLLSQAAAIRALKSGGENE